MFRQFGDKHAAVKYTSDCKTLSPRCKKRIFSYIVLSPCIPRFTSSWELNHVISKLYSIFLRSQGRSTENVVVVLRFEFDCFITCNDCPFLFRRSWGFAFNLFTLCCCCCWEMRFDNSNNCWNWFWPTTFWGSNIWRVWTIRLINWEILFAVQEGTASSVNRRNYCVSNSVALTIDKEVC